MRINPPTRLARHGCFARTLGLGRWLALLPLICNAQLHFPSALTDALNGTVLGQDTKKVTIVIHGYQPGAGSGNAYASGALYNLSQQLSDTLYGTDWKLVLYHWEEDADTGGLSFANAEAAAGHAWSHGYNIAQVLNQEAPNVRQVHFVAHSAGIWAAYQAAQELLLLNPYVTVQISLLDAFIPASVDAYSPFTVSLISNLAFGFGNERIFMLENYHGTLANGDLADILGPACANTFTWRPNIDTNLVIDIGGCYEANFGHDGPIDFYADTVLAALPFPNGEVSTCLADAPYVFINVGFYKSLFYQTPFLPRISIQPQGVTTVQGVTVVLNVSAFSSQSLSYQWFTSGQPIAGATGASYSFIASASTAGDYVVKVSNQNGFVFSDKAAVSVSAPATPSITSISPATLSPSSSPQPISIYGSNFLPSADANASKLIFYDPANNPTPPRIPTYVNLGRLDYNATLSVPGPWKVKVLNGSVESPPFNFTVASVSAQLTALSISGSASVSKNSSAQYTATGIFSDGSSSTVMPSWSLNSGAPASISSSGQLTAGNVSANTLITITATFTLSGITKAAAYNVTIVTGGTSYQVEELVNNGTFSSGSTGWTLTGNFQADKRFATYNNEPGYAYLANSDGSADNNLSGTLSQTVTIPANATSATLGYYYRITSSDTSGVAHDHLHLQLNVGPGTQVGLDDKSNVNANTAYGYASFNVIAYKGSTVTVYFASTTDATLPTTFRVDDVSLLVTVPISPTPVLFGVGGPTSVPEGGSAQYNAVVVYSDGSVQLVAPNWSVSGPATITSSGLLRAGNVSSDTPATVIGNYSGFPALNYSITIVNVAPVYISLAISGPGSMNENSSAQFTGAALYSDGTAQSGSVSWSVISGPGSISSSGLLTVGEVSNNTTTTVSASCTIGGVTHSTTQQVTVLNVPTAPTLASLSISGPSSFNENSTAEYSATAWFSDGSSQVVVPTWSVDSVAASISSFGLLSAGEVASNSSVTVSASYTTGGITRSAQENVTVINTITYTISGYVRTPAGSGISGVTVSGLPGNPSTDANGYYSATVTSGWSGTATPSAAGYTFSPPTRSYSNVPGNQTGQDYTGTPVTYTISGNVRTFGGSGISGVTMSGLPSSPTTDANGHYSATVTSGWSGRATPGAAGYTFSPTSRSYSNVPGNQTAQDYTGTPITYTITGNVRTSGGAGISGVTMSGLPGNPTTDANGYYTATVTSGWSGTATPGAAGYTFTPPSRSYSSVPGSQTGQDYTGAPITYTVSGNVRASGGGGISGVTMSGLPGNPTTDANGYYSATVTSGWSGTATPGAAGYTFTPPSRSYSNVPGNQIAQDYTGMSVPATNSPPQLSGMTLSNGLSRFVLNGPVGSNYIIQASSNLVDWSAISLSTIPVAGSVIITDPDVSNQPRRFYRAVQAPTNMVLILAGSFTMGNCMDPSEGNSAELPLHTVYVSAFYMDEYIVTKALWDGVYNWAIMHGYSFDNAGSGKAANHPVTSVSWYDCVKWCNARSEMEGWTPAYYTSAAQTTVYRTGQTDVQNDWVKWSSGYRLPTEAEWEKAARGGLSGHRFPWGDTISQSQANYYACPSCYGYDANPTTGYHPAFNDGVYPYTSPVGYFAPNGYGLYDMAGNAWQWCWDWYGWYNAGSQSDPHGPASAQSRVIRGGNWFDPALNCRTSFRNGRNMALSDGSILDSGGIRSVLPAGQP